jgi:hypothetical protein
MSSEVCAVRGRDAHVYIWAAATDRGGDLGQHQHAAPCGTGASSRGGGDDGGSSIMVDSAPRLSAIEVTGGTNWILMHSTVQYTGGVAVLLTGGNYSTLRPSGHVIANNTITDFNRKQGGFLAGLKIGVGVQVLNNEIARGAAQAVLWSGNNHRIARNVIHDACLNSFDCGAIYESERNWVMRGTIIEANLIFRVGRPATVCNSRTSCGRHAIYRIPLQQVCPDQKWK